METIDGVLPGIRVGPVLRDRREERGLTQAELAAASGVSLAAIRDLEQGRSRRPRRESLLALATALALAEEETAALLSSATSPARQPVVSSSSATSQTTRICVLGPLSVTRDGGPVTITGKPALLLGRLAMSPNETAGERELIELLWPGSPPTTAPKLLQGVVAHLRGSIAPVTVDRVDGGYRLNASSEELDLVEFRALVADSRVQAPDDPEPLVEATRLWRGPPGVVGLQDGVLAESITDEYAAVVTRWAQLARDAGQGEQVIPRLRELTGLRPLDEALGAELVMTLGAVGRQADALAAYDRIRDLLRDELGVRPGPLLADAYQSVLEQRWRSALPSTPTPPAARPPSGPQRIVPRQTPGPPFIVGREHELEVIVHALADTERVALALISGQAGVGKSSLAFAAAERLLKQFPDGQLYANMHEIPGGPADPADVLGRFLRALGVPSQQIPADTAEAAALFRTELADRRILVVLDSVHDAAQLLPLLPGAGSSCVIATSRNRLPDLSGSVFVARQVHLDQLSVDAGVELIAAIIGVERVSDSLDAARELARACGGLPLAIRIAAARLANRPRLSVTQYARRLSDTASRLSELTVGVTSVTASFQVSYDGTRPAAQRAFRLGALVPADTFSVGAAAALLDLDPYDAQDLLEELVDANMLQTVDDPDHDDRYRYHDLLRLHAAQLVADDDERDLAEHRLGEWLLQTATAAVDATYPGRFRALALPTEAGPVFVDADAARSWLDAESGLIVAFVEHAADEEELRQYAWKLADQCRIFFRTRVDLDRYLRFLEAGTRAALADGVSRPHGFLLTLCAEALDVLGRHDEAHVAAHAAVAVIEGLDWPDGMAFTSIILGKQLRDRAHFDEAETAFRNALDASSRGGAPGIQAWAAELLGTQRLWKGDYAESHDLYALALDLDERFNGGTTLDLAGLGAAERELGFFDAAQEHLDQALAQARHLGSPYAELIVLDELSLLALARGDADTALTLSREYQTAASSYGDVRFIATAASTLAAAMLASGAVTDSMCAFREALDLSRRHTAPYVEATVLIGLAGALRASRSTAEARQLAGEALALADRHGFAARAADATSLLAEIDAG